MDTKASMHDRIVEAALECMREHGVRGATTKTISRRAGVSEGSIYNHFSSRSELIIEALRLATNPIRQRARGLEEQVGAHTVEHNLVSLMESVITFFRGINPIVGSILGDPELRSWFTQGHVSDPEGRQLSPLTGVVELSSYLEHEHRLGRLPRRESWGASATMLIGACLHYVYLEELSPSGVGAALPGGESSPAEYSRTVVQTLFGQTGG